LQSHVQSPKQYAELAFSPTARDQFKKQTKSSCKNTEIYPYFSVSTCPSLGAILHPRKAQGNRTFSSTYWGSVFQEHDLENALPISSIQLIARSTLEDPKRIKAGSVGPVAGQSGGRTGHRHRTALLGRTPAAPGWAETGSWAKGVGRSGWR